MNAQWIVLAMVSALGMRAADVAGDKQPAVRIAYLGIHDGKVRRTGKPIRVAALRMDNLSTETIQFARVGWNPDMLIHRQTADGWESAVGWNWCGMGKSSGTVEPSASLTWCIDPAYYSGKYGQTLRIGVLVGLKQSQKPMFVWTEAIAFPKVENPPVVEFNGALYGDDAPMNRKRPTNVSAYSVPVSRGRCRIRSR